MRNYFLIILFVQIPTYACFKCNTNKSSHKKAAKIQQDLERIAQINNPHDIVISFDECKKEMKTKTISRLIHYSQKENASWSLKVIEDPCSCISIPEPDEIYENQGLTAKKNTNNILYTWNIQIKSVGIARIQATFNSPHKVETQDFIFTVTD